MWVRAFESMPEIKDRGRPTRSSGGRYTGSGWDPELLRLELGELKLSGFDLSLTGFGDLELAGIMAERTEGLTDPDDAPAVPERHAPRREQGRHHPLVGDADGRPRGRRRRETSNARQFGR